MSYIATDQDKRVCVKCTHFHGQCCTLYVDRIFGQPVLCEQMRGNPLDPCGPEGKLYQHKEQAPSAEGN